LASLGYKVRPSLKKKKKKEGKARCPVAHSCNPSYFETETGRIIV
jgi:hypothetical protein